MRTEAVVNSQGQTGYLTKGKVLFKLKLWIFVFLTFICQNVHWEKWFAVSFIGLSLKFTNFGL